MGLDTVELIMGIEDEFGIIIPDEDVENLQTMQEAHNYIFNQLRTRPIFPCPNQHAFYQLRKALLEIGNFSRSSIRPDSKTRQFLPEHYPYRFWKELKKQTDCTFPDLTLNPKIGLYGLILPLCFTAGIFCLFYKFDELSSTLVTSIAFLFFSFIFYVAFLYALGGIPALCTNIPRECKTLRSFSKHTARTNYVSVKSSEVNVWNRLCRVVSEFSGVKEEDLKPETNLLTELF